MRQVTEREWQVVAVVCAVNVAVFGSLGFVWHTLAFGLACIASLVGARRAKRSSVQSE